MLCFYNHTSSNDITMLLSSVVVVVIHRELISGLLVHKVIDRLGSLSSEQVLGHPYFAHVDFSQIWSSSSPLVLDVSTVHTIYLYILTRLACHYFINIISLRPLS